MKALQQISVWMKVLDPKGLNIITAKGSKKVQVRSTGKKVRAKTVVACGNACGQISSLMLIFDAIMHRHKEV